MKRFWYKFLVCVLSLGMLYPAWTASNVEKAQANVDTIPPFLTDVSFLSQENSGPFSPMPGSMSSGFYLKTSNISTDDYRLRFSSTSGTSEPLLAGYNGLYLDPTLTSVSVADLMDYYNSRTMPASYRDYLIDALDGVTRPFAYIKTDDTINYSLVDAARYDLAGVEVDMTIPGDYPEGRYAVKGEIKDLASNVGDVSFKMIVDHTPPSVKIINPLPDSYVTSSTLVSFTNDDPNSPECSIDNVNWAPCTAGVVKLGDIIGFNALPAGTFTLYLRDIDVAGNIGNDSITLKKYIALSAPENLAVTVGDGEISLAWDPVVGAVSYNVYYKKTSEVDYAGPVNVTSTSTKITGLENGLSYDFKVVAVNENGVGGESVVVTATPKSSAVVLASAPTVQDAVVAQPETPVVTPEVTPPTEETGPEIGQIKGEETAATEEEDINWTPWIILFVLIVLAGAATGGYFYWFGNEEEEIVSEKVIEKTRKSNGKKSSGSKPSAKKSKRW
jgi:hypothetical protein